MHFGTLLCVMHAEAALHVAWRFDPDIDFLLQQCSAT